jgi:GH35 family endo-1,4-beta-xylanase
MRTQPSTRALFLSMLLVLFVGGCAGPASSSTPFPATAGASEITTALPPISTPMPTPFPSDQNADSIRKYAEARNIKIGALAIGSKYGNWSDIPGYLQTLAREFNLTLLNNGIPPEWKPTDIAAMDFDYTVMERSFAFAESNGLAIKAVTGGWWGQNPRWIYDATHDELKAYLDRKVEQDLSRYKGKVLFWDVFNEVINDSADGFRDRQHKGEAYLGDFAPYGGGYSPWVDGTDTSLIEEAFYKARATDPQAKLFINEFNDEEIGKKKSEYFYHFVTDMKKKGVPVDGVGFQLHLIYPNLPWMPSLEKLDAYLARVDQNIKRYAQAGLMVEFSEVECQIRLDDIDLATPAGKLEYERRSKKQADVYRGFTKLARDNPNVIAFIIWAAADNVDSTGFSNDIPPAYIFKGVDAFLLDKNYHPKPAYIAVLDELKNPSPANQAAGLPASPAVLKARWSFDEGKGYAVADSSGNGNAGTLQAGASWATGKVGPHALALNGAGSSYVIVPKAVVDTGQSFSVAAWVKLNALNNWQTAVSIDGVNNSGFYLQWNKGLGTFAFSVVPSDAKNPQGQSVPANIKSETGIWYHLVGVYDGDLLKLYVNGELQNEDQFATAWTAKGPTIIGRAKVNGSPVDLFNGQIDDVRIYSGVLTDAEIKELAEGS